MNKNLKSKTLKNNSSKSIFPDTTDWSDINWRKIKKSTEKLQWRIFRVRIKNNYRQVKRLQRMLIYKKSTLLLAIKRVTMIDKDKISHDIEGFISLGDKELAELFDTMKTMNIKLHKPKPAYHNHIKTKKGKLRSVGMPTIRDWVYQEITRMTLEPQFEISFEPSIYGFRPNRSCKMALEEIKKIITSTNWNWVFKSDFNSCFDTISHDFILNQMVGFQLRDLIAKFLKAGYLDNDVFNSFGDGTPQAGPLPPLLANIALNGMEKALGIVHSITEDGDIYETKGKYRMIRYAGDFLIFADSKEDIEAIPNILNPYLEERGLKLDENKVDITKVSDGFDFLGHNFRK